MRCDAVVISEPARDLIEHDRVDGLVAVALGRRFGPVALWAFLMLLAWSPYVYYMGAYRAAVAAASVR